MPHRIPQGQQAVQKLEATTTPSARLNRPGAIHLEQTGPTVQLNIDWHTRDPITTNSAVTAEEWKNVRAGRYELGMSEAAVRLILGSPAKVNRTSLEGLDLEQHVYPGILSGKTKYFYYENGVLRVIQD